MTKKLSADGVLHIDRASRRSFTYRIDWSQLATRPDTPTAHPETTSGVEAGEAEAVSGSRAETTSAHPEATSGQADLTSPDVVSGGGKSLPVTRKSLPVEPEAASPEAGHERRRSSTAAPDGSISEEGAGKAEGEPAPGPESTLIEEVFYSPRLLDPLKKAGLRTLGDVAAYDRGSLAVVADLHNRGLLNAIEGTLRRLGMDWAVLGQEPEGADQTTTARSSSPHKPWEERVPLAVPANILDHYDAEGWVKSKRWVLVKMWGRVREAGGGWPELEQWITPQVDDIAAVMKAVKTDGLGGPVRGVA